MSDAGNVGYWLRGEHLGWTGVIAAGRNLTNWLPKAKARRHPPTAAKGIKRLRPTASATSENEPRRKRKHRLSAFDDLTERYKPADDSDLVELVEDDCCSHLRIHRANSTKPVSSHPPTRSKRPVNVNNIARGNHVVMTRTPSNSSSASASRSSASIPTADDEGDMGFVYYTL